MSDRRVRFKSQQQRKRVGQQLQRIEAVDFFNVLTDTQLLQTTEAHLPEHRERLYPPTVTLSMFMRQVLEADGSCQKAVNGWAAQRARDGLSKCSVRTGGYCRARQRLPLEMVRTLVRRTDRILSEKAARKWLWRGHRVKLVDGSGLSRSDRFTAAQLTKLLSHMFHHSSSSQFARSLPYSGEPELRWERRLAQAPYKGNVLAKTGTLSNVSTLSGYAKGRSGKVYAFSILCNGTKGNARAMGAQDAVLRALIDRG